MRTHHNANHHDSLTIGTDAQIDKQVRSGSLAHELREVAPPGEVELALHLLVEVPKDVDLMR